MTKFQVDALSIPEVLMIKPTKHADQRGFFSEVYNKKALAEVGIFDEFVQDNHSLSGPAGVLRGLHFQVDPYPTAKLVRVARGSVWDVAVDLRAGSPTFGEHVAAKLSGENWHQVYVPVGFAHGFCTLEPNTEVLYKTTAHWTPEVDKGLAWDDPDLDIAWPLSSREVMISAKDRSQPRLSELPTYFEFGAGK